MTGSDCETLRNLILFLQRLSNGSYFVSSKREGFRMKIQDYMPEQVTPFVVPKQRTNAGCERRPGSRIHTEQELTETPPLPHNILIPLPSKDPAQWHSCRSSAKPIL